MNEPGIRSYRELRVWQLGIELTAGFLKSEMYGLTSQMRRAAGSIPANIAERFGRTPADYARYLNIARGSGAELATHVEIAHRVGYVKQPQYADLVGRCDALGAQIYALVQQVERRKRPTS